MATIHDLNTSLSAMSDSDVFELIKKRRMSRRVPKESNKKVMKKVVTRAKAKAKTDPKQLLQLLTPAQKAALFAELGE